MITMNTDKGTFSGSIKETAESVKQLLQLPRHVVQWYGEEYCEILSDERVSCSLEGNAQDMAEMWGLVGE